MRRYLILASLLCSAPAFATAGISADGLQAMREVNLIVLGTLTANGQEVEGRTFAGTLNASNNTNFGIGRAGQGSAPSSTFDVLDVVNNASGAWRLKSGAPNGGNGIVGTTAVIGGNVGAFDFNDNAPYVGSLKVGGNLGGPGNVNNHSVRYGGTVGGGINNAIRDASLAAGGANDVHAAQLAKLATLTADLTALSGQLAGLPSLATITSTANALDYSGAAGGYAVFTMTAGAFQDQNSNFDSLFSAAPSGYTTIINVLGTSLTETGNSNSAALNQNVIWNFNQATSLSLRGFHGSVLAPFANVSNSSALEGSIVAANFTLNGEIHLGTYGGTSTFLTRESAVPEPASWAMMLAGFGGVGAMIRRPRRRAAIAA